MYGFETEDMLPRPAPKPTLDNAAAAAMAILARPTVPEVSILVGGQQNTIGFNSKGRIITTSEAMTNNGSGSGSPVSPLNANNFRNANNNNNAQTAAPATSYAAWKKQVMPKMPSPSVSSSSSGACNALASSMYPLRSSESGTTVNYTMASSAASTVSALGNTATTANSCHSVGSSAQTVRRSWEGVCYSNNAPPTRPNSELAYFADGSVRIMQRRSLDIVTQSNNNPNGVQKRDVLTICAGTQTDVCEERLTANDAKSLATKQDVQQLIDLINTMHSEQKRLSRICETLLQQNEFFESLHRMQSAEGCQQAAQSNSKRICRDVSTQCTITSENPADAQNSPHLQDYFKSRTPSGSPNIVNAKTDQVVQEAKIYNHLKENNAFQSPRSVPVAQSTGYRPNTPVTSRQAPRQQQQNQMRRQIASPQQENSPGTYVLPKPTTDKSMVMNELALKYLPSEKLSELLQDAHIASNSGSTPPKHASPIFRALPLRQIDNLDKGLNNISNDSYKYLKKYRLLPDEADQIESNNGSPNSAGDNFHHMGAQQQSPLLAANTPGRLRRISENSPFQVEQQNDVHLQQVRFNGNSPRLPPMTTNGHIEIEQYKGQPKLL